VARDLDQFGECLAPVGLHIVPTASPETARCGGAAMNRPIRPLHPQTQFDTVRIGIPERAGSLPSSIHV
jgi:hypothetical protein